MASKSSQGKTNKYSSVVKSVQKAQQPEEPRITSQQVVAAFKSFGFEPNDRNHNDIGYWTTKGQSEGAKLMEELHKRRTDIMKKEDDAKKVEEDKNKVHETLKNQQETDKATMSRLSDQDITALYDEYGLPAPDPEWARNHLPNDPKKIRSILEMQRKMADDMLKKHSKNAVNTIPEVPKSQPGMPAAPMQASPAMGMGGPMDIQGAMTQPEAPTTPFFIGDFGLVRITNPNNPNSTTLWLVDKNKKTLQPFLSEKAFQNAFEDPAEAEKSIITLSSKELGPGGVLEGFKPVDGKQGVGHDGSVGKIDFSPAQIGKRYGKTSDPAVENRALSMLDGVMGNLSKAQ